MIVTELMLVQFKSTVFPEFAAMGSDTGELLPPFGVKVHVDPPEASASSANILFKSTAWLKDTVIDESWFGLGL